jgi:gamma-glutamyltranspeptidase
LFFILRPSNFGVAIFQKLADNKTLELKPYSNSVPGCVAGWCDLNEKFGSKPLSELLKESIDAAENGFPVAEVTIVVGFFESIHLFILS